MIICENVICLFAASLHWLKQTFQLKVGACGRQNTEAQNTSYSMAMTLLQHRDRHVIQVSWHYNSFMRKKVYYHNTFVSAVIECVSNDICLSADTSLSFIQPFASLNPFHLNVFHYFCVDVSWLICQALHFIFCVPQSFHVRHFPSIKHTLCEMTTFHKFAAEMSITYSESQFQRLHTHCMYL